MFPNKIICIHSALQQGSRVFLWLLWLSFNPGPKIFRNAKVDGSWASCSFMLACCISEEVSWTLAFKRGRDTSLGHQRLKWVIIGLYCAWVVIMVAVKHGGIVVVLENVYPNPYLCTKSLKFLGNQVNIKFSLCTEPFFYPWVAFLRC